MRKLLLAAAVAALLAPTMASADALLVSPNGTTRIGINTDGSLDATFSGIGTVGIGYNFTGQGGRTGFQDALSPGCFWESWGVSTGTSGGAVGRANGNQNILVGAAA